MECGTTILVTFKRPENSEGFLLRGASPAGGDMMFMEYTVYVLVSGEGYDYDHFFSTIVSGDTVSNDGIPKTNICQ